ncbi:MAG: pentapeptide repeat-containing protein [Anaerolineae bacterium]|nr:pentapeptide repeat-containing protein [Anaerolineae bacterium]
MDREEVIDELLSHNFNFTGENLRGADLSFMHFLPRTIFNKARLPDAQLIGANLAGVDLREAHLEVACLIEADLREADLREAHLNGADIRGANFSGADLRGASLKGVENSKTADFTDAIYDERTILPDGTSYNPSVWERVRYQIPFGGLLSPAPSPGRLAPRPIATSPWKVVAFWRGLALMLLVALILSVVFSFRPSEETLVCNKSLDDPCTEFDTCEAYASYLVKCDTSRDTVCRRCPEWGQ